MVKHVKLENIDLITCLKEIDKHGMDYVIDKYAVEVEENADIEVIEERGD